MSARRKAIRSSTSFRASSAERLGLEVALEPGLEPFRVGPQADVGTRLRLGAEQQAEGAEVVQTVLDELVSRDGEVRGGDVEVAPILGIEPFSIT